jgi:hypothetical protein
MSKDGKKDIFEIMDGIEVRDPTVEEVMISRYNVLIFIGSLIQNVKDIPSDASGEEGETYRAALEHLEAMQFQATVMPESFFEDVARKSISCVRVEEIINKEDDEDETDKEPVLH